MKYCMLLVLAISLNLSAQDCKLVTRTSKKSSEIQSKGGSAQSKDFLLLYLEKLYDPKNPDDTLNYSAMIIVGSRYHLKDSIIKARGTFEFLLSNGESVSWSNAEASNLGDVFMTSYANHIMFSVKVTKEQFTSLTKSYITRLETFDIVQTEFGTKSQRQLLSIANCLINGAINWD